MPVDETVTTTSMSRAAMLAQAMTRSAASMNSSVAPRGFRARPQILRCLEPIGRTDGVAMRNTGVDEYVIQLRKAREDLREYSSGAAGDVVLVETVRWHRRRKGEDGNRQNHPGRLGA
jgi:hypothetical protein